MGFTCPAELFQLSQSRRQSNSAHKRKGWHAVQHTPADGVSGTNRLGNNPAAVYVRPDHSVHAKISLDDSPSFPSLGSFAAALPSQQSQNGASTSKASHNKAWTPQKQPAQPANSNDSPAKPKYSAAALPARPKQDAGSNKSMALSDAELTDLTMLLSTHPWAEPGLARVRLAIHFKPYHASALLDACMWPLCSNAHVLS